MSPMLDEIDPTGRARDGLEDALGTTRAGFLLGLLTAAGVAGSIDDADAGAMAPGDVAILRFDLQFEYLQATMYTEAVRIGHLSPKAREVARVVGAHEWAHAHALRQLLGDRSACGRRASSRRRRRCTAWRRGMPRG